MIYLDNAATTKPYTECFSHIFEVYGNPSATYGLGREARMAIAEAREIIAKSINASPEEIFFTSGATESNNWVRKFASFPDFYFCTTTIEHKSISTRIADTLFPVNEDGIVGMDFVHLLNDLYRDDKIGINPFVSVMYANNEIGTIQPIKSLASVTHAFDGLFHTDATQAYMHIPIDVKDQKIDLMSISAHKTHGLKGVGALYINKSILTGKYSIPSILSGGGQESGLRSGTENVPGIMAFGEAVKIQSKKMHSEALRQASIRDRLYNEISNCVSDCKLNGVALDSGRRLPNNLNICIEGINAQELVQMLDERDICISAGSACNSGDPSPSHVLMAIGLTEEEALSSIRITVGDETKEEDIPVTVSALKECVNILRMY